MRVAIHQPNFLPWMGYFQKIHLADVFVILDHVQASHGSGWLSRNRLLIRGDRTWLTIPVKRSGRGLQLINCVEISYDRHIVPKHLRVIDASYRRASYFEDVFPVLSTILKKKHRYISDLNMDLVLWVCSYLGLSARFVKSSDLQAKNSKIEAKSGNDLLLEICRMVGASSYVSGNGCLDFIEPKSFANLGIEFYFQEFKHPTYPQVGGKTFMSHLSILDALFNVEPEEVARMVRQPGLRSAN